jgi:hypothetical protein
VIIDRSQQSWIAATSAIGSAASLAYIIYALKAANGPRGGTTAGLVFAFAGTALIVFEALLSLRKKYPASPFGRVLTWLKAHVWLGFLSFLMILFHAGFHWGHGLAALLMWTFAAITLSGIYGLVMQIYIPRRLTELVTHETIYQQIPAVIKQLRLEADVRMQLLTGELGVEEEEEEFQFAGGKAYSLDPAKRKSVVERDREERAQRRAAMRIPMDDAVREAMKALYLQELRPFLVARPQPSNTRLFQTAAAVTNFFDYLRKLAPTPGHDVLEDVENICEERRQLAVQEGLHRWLHGWLYVHVPLSTAFLVLVLIHAVLSLRY